jgi:hypothetical protein
MTTGDYAIVLLVTPAGVAAIGGLVYGVRHYRKRKRRG